MFTRNEVTSGGRLAMNHRLSGIISIEHSIFRNWTMQSGWVISRLAGCANRTSNYLHYICKRSSTSEQAIIIRPSFDGRIMVRRCPSERPSVCSVVHNPCGQDIARTIWPRMLKLSVYTKYVKRKKPINFQGQRSHFKVTGPLQRILALGSLWAGYSKNYLA